MVEENCFKSSIEKAALAAAHSAHVQSIDRLHAMALASFLSAVLDPHRKVVHSSSREVENASKRPLPSFLYILQLAVALALKVSKKVFTRVRRLLGS